MTIEAKYLELIKKGEDEYQDSIRQVEEARRLLSRCEAALVRSADFLREVRAEYQTMPSELAMAQFDDMEAISG